MMNARSLSRSAAGLLALAASPLVLAAGPFTGIVGALLGQPAAWTVPLAFAAGIIVSLRTSDRGRRTADSAMARLHAPEELDTRR